ncbi:DUF58 domain-containing protein [Pseudofrankia inefficax]|uniref:DUF58 domain-containing protein n=1 Tax=Pseudofrankia inefficax (strain DSM 45817 / CECT 9037 / DDB 130130 / EuI1c) TaxID=298654 RepID=E3IWI3_PSEI1|nr:DUF58 domain-containing protein [Pseudofrankia inefficax]ADP80166.1 protein of unknown function DUF58 [Pseudofrankia inefficax]
MTTTGRVVLLSSLLLGLAAWLLDYPELLVCAVSGIVGMVAACTWWILPAPFEVTRQFADNRVVEGGALRGTIVITNLSRRRRIPRLTIVETVNGQRMTFTSAPIGPGGFGTEHYAIPARRRGPLTFQPVRTECTDPLGLIRFSRSSGPALEMLVHPFLHRIPALDVPGTTDLEGGSPDIAPQAGAELHSLRKYVAGDDPRLIDWRATGRIGYPLIRLNLVPKMPRGIVVLDTAADTYQGDQFEDAVRVAGALGDAALTRGQPVEIWTTERSRCAALPGSAARGKMLDFLARVTTSGAPQTYDVTSPSALTTVIVSGFRTGAPELLPNRSSEIWLIRVGAPREHSSVSRTVRVVDVPDADSFKRFWPGLVRG